MKLTVLATLSLLMIIGVVSELPRLQQTPLEPQLKQAFGTQNWGQTIKAVNQMQSGTPPKSNSQLTLYRSLLSSKQAQTLKH